MVDGRFKCMGSVQHLKTKFGDGYTLTVKIKEMPNHLACVSSSSFNKIDDTDDEYTSSRLKSKRAEQGPSNNKYINLILNELKEKINSQCKLKERHFNNVYQFELPSPESFELSNSLSYSFNIGDIYRLIELNKLRFNVADYSLSQNTLDNVFINFVKEQTSKKRKNKCSNVDDDENLNCDSSEDEEIESLRNLKNVQKRHSAQIQFPIHDTDDILIDAVDDNLIDFESLSSSQLVLSSSSHTNLLKFNLSNQDHVSHR